MQAVITNTCYTKTVLLLKSEYDNLSEDGCFTQLLERNMTIKAMLFMILWIYYQLLLK